jgi:small subunit ribosomal protein S2
VESTAQQIGVRELLEAGVHFGHQAKRWNPKMKKFIFAERAGVHIIDLDLTLTLLDRALAFAKSIGEAGREILFVGTKKQAQLTIAEQAMRSGQPYVAERYIGGMLTNFQTIQPRIQYFKDLAVRVDETPEEDRSGKDWFAMTREFQKLRRNFAGLTEMERLPGAIFVVDPKREELLVKEANRLRIPVVALTDTNCDPEVVDYIIPGNDDAIRSINLISKLMADAVLDGRGEDEVHPEDRLVPPAVEEARVAEEIAAGNAANGSSADSAPSAEAPAAPESETADVVVVEEAEVPVEVEVPEAAEVEASAEEAEVTEPEPTVEAVPEDAPDTEAEVTDVTASEAPEIADEEAEADEAEAREVAASVEEVDEPVEAPAADEADSGEAATEEQAEADEEGNTEEQEEER